MSGCVSNTKEVGYLTADRRPSAENYYQHTKNLLRVLKGAWNLCCDSQEQRTAFIVTGQYWKTDQESKRVAVANGDINKP
jgi:hypothetical protein